MYQQARVSFQKIKEIGQEGQNSKVFIIHDEYLDAELVLKEINKERFSSDEYFREAQTLYKSSHPHIVDINYACEDDEKVYIVSPYYRNGSLKQIISNRFLTIKEIIRYSTHIASGLQNIHSKGLIHFDIKPSNILISDRNEALIGDFGLTKLMNQDGVAAEKDLYVIHTPPEVMGNPDFVFDNRLDIYQLGLTMYRMCVGEADFSYQYDNYKKGDNLDGRKFGEALFYGEFPDRNRFPLHIPDKLQNIVKRCLEPNKRKRYDSTIQIVNSLASIEGQILDWQYEICSDYKRWKKEDESGTLLRELYWYNDGSSEAFKKRGSGQVKIRGMCKQTVSEEEIIVFLEG